MYSAKCPEETCNETYNGETGRILVERIDKHMCINIEWIAIMPLRLLMTLLFLIPDTNIKSIKRKIRRLYLLKTIYLTLTNMTYQFSWNFVIETFNTLILTSDIDFPKSDIIIGWVLPEINNILIYWFPVPFFIVSIVLTSCTFFS